jgi:predicted ATPase/class 3 adenylate cyclase/Tfp pilus assembly protein PilF
VTTAAGAPLEDAAENHVAPAMAPLDTLTFLFTDMEGSTPLWEHHEATMRAVTARHDALVDAALARLGTRRVRERGEGDSIFAVFSQPATALIAALEIMRVLLVEPWPLETPVRVRMGLHVGMAHYREGDYYGPAVNRGARIRSLANGGQILLSARTAELVRDVLPPGATLRALGAHSLRGLTAPEALYQVCHPDLPAEFPPLVAPPAPHHNLPAASGALIGREREQAAVLALLGTERLVTLVGTGGVGKTRVALAAAAEVVDRCPQGVWLVELASLADPGLVPDAALRVFGLREEVGRTTLEMLTEHLRRKDLLLVLDNCEHLVAACAALAHTLLQACPQVRILATSREGLGVAVERRYRVPSLTIPDPRHPPPVELVESYEAVRLFVVRARARRQDFELTAANALTVAEVCARLDGIPLAIELAAARVGVLSVAAIADRLDDRFRLLTGGPRDVLPRQQTLRATLDWSWELLDQSEQALLRRQAVFVGGWTLDAAEAVCANGSVEPAHVLDLLDGLVTKSLVVMEEQEGMVRFRLLETVRQYAHEQLLTAGEEPAMRVRHVGWCLSLAEEAALKLTGPDQRIWLERLEVEYGNLRVALSWSIGESGDRAIGLRMAGALWRFWSTHGHLHEGRAWLRAALERDSSTSPAVRASALTAAGGLCLDQGDLKQARVFLEEALGLQRGLRNMRGVAAALTNLGHIAMGHADFGSARVTWDECLSIFRELQDKRGTASLLLNLGWLATEQDEFERASVLTEESLVLWRELGDLQEIATAGSILGIVATEQGRYDHARTLLQESLALHRQLGHKRGIAYVLTLLADVERLLDDFAQSRQLQEESLSIAREIGDLRNIAVALINLGIVASHNRDFERARSLHEEGLALFRNVGDKLGIAYALTHLGSAAAQQGDSPRAITQLAESLTLQHSLGSRNGVRRSLQALAHALQYQQPERSARLFGAAETLCQELGVVLSPGEQARRGLALATLRVVLSDGIFEMALMAGRTLSTEHAIAYALAALPT